MAVHRRSQTLRHLRVALALLVLCACNSQAEKPDNRLVCQLYAGHADRVEVIATGTVTRILGERRGPSGEHEGYILQTDGDCDVTLRVETNEDLTGPVPLHDGERVIVKGEYIFNPQGGLLHWTHRDPRGRHINGYVYADGKYYQ